MQLGRWRRRVPLESNVRPHDSAPHLKWPLINKVKSPAKMTASNLKCTIHVDNPPLVLGSGEMDWEGSKFDCSQW